MSMTKADNTLWLAYTDLIRRLLEVDIVGPKDVIIPYPVTQRGIAAGNTIPEPVTNFLVYNLADNLRLAASPDSKTAGSYTDELRQYLNWVEPAPPPTSERLQRLEYAYSTLEQAEENFDKVDDEAHARYEKAKMRDPDIPSYHVWVVKNAQDFVQMKETVNDAAYEVRTARTDCYGPDASQLNEYLTALEIATNRTTKADTWNMPALTTDLRNKFEDENGSDGSVSPEDEYAVEMASTRVPVYQINTLFSTMNDWIRQRSGPRRQWLKLDLSVGQSKTWKDFGFITHKPVFRSESWFPFFSAVVERDNVKKTEYLNIENEEINITIELSFQQIAALDIQRGLWDVANVKSRFPNLRKDAPSVLSDAVLVNTVLFAYDVALRATFSGSLKRKAHDLLEDAKKTGVGMWIFGFRVGGQSEKYVKTEFDSVKWDEVTGSIVLEPSRDAAYPTQLGLLGQRL